MTQRTAAQVTEGFRRLGIAVGICGAITAIVIGGFAVWSAAQEHGWLSRVVLQRVGYTAGAAVLVALVAGLLAELTGWVVEGFVTGRPTDPAKTRSVRDLIVAFAIMAGAVAFGLGFHTLATSLLDRWPWPIEGLVDATYRGVPLATYVERDTFWAIYREVIAGSAGIIGWIVGLILVVWLTTKLRPEATHRE